jgi:hypothetical protein
MSIKSPKKPKPPKLRFPLPVKPPKVETDPTSYRRREKHKRVWEDQLENDTAVPDKPEK